MKRARVTAASLAAVLTPLAGIAVGLAGIAAPQGLGVEPVGFRKDVDRVSAPVQNAGPAGSPGEGQVDVIDAEINFVKLAKADAVMMIAGQGKSPERSSAPAADPDGADQAILLDADLTKPSTHDECESIGGFLQPFVFPQRYRGNMLHVTDAAELLEFSMELSITGEVDLYFSIHVLVEEDGCFHRLIDDVVVTVTGNGRDFYSSGPLTDSEGGPLFLDPGDTGLDYALGVGWGSASITYGRDGLFYPQPFSHGSIRGLVSASLPSGPPLDPSDDGVCWTPYIGGAYSMELCLAHDGDKFTIGGAIYDDCGNPLTNGASGITVNVVGTGGSFNATTSGEAGTWSIPDVPYGTYTVTPKGPTCHVSGTCPPDPCASSTTIVVDALHEPQNQSIQFFASCILYDMNFDGFPSVIGDVPRFVDCVYFGNCDCPGLGCVCPGDCNCDGFLSIIGDVPCFVDCVYFANCADCPGLRRR